MASSPPTRKDLHRVIKKKRVSSEREAEAGENSFFLATADGELQAYVSPTKAPGSASSLKGRLDGGRPPQSVKVTPSTVIRQSARLRAPRFSPKEESRPFRHSSPGNSNPVTLSFDSEERSSFSGFSDWLCEQWNTEAGATRSMSQGDASDGNHWQLQEARLEVAKLEWRLKESELSIKGKESRAFNRGHALGHLEGEVARAKKDLTNEYGWSTVFSQLSDDGEEGKMP